MSFETALDAGPAALGMQIAEIKTQVTYPAPIANAQGDIVLAASLVGDPYVGGVFTSLNAIDPKGPSISSVSVAKGKLVVTGANFKRGAKIVVGTTPYQDTKRDAKTPKTKLTSRTADDLASTQEGIIVSVLNPDGRRSAAVVFVLPAEPRHADGGLVPAAARCVTWRSL